MKKLISLVLLIAGVVLFVLGVIEADSIGSAFSRLFSDEPTDKAIWLLIGGGVLGIAGLVGLTRGSK